MFWINTSGDIVKLNIDLGNGRQLIPVLPSRTIELPETITKDVMEMMAPQLKEYVLEVIETVPEVVIDTLPVEIQKAVLDEKAFKAKRGRKPNKDK